MRRYFVLLLSLALAASTAGAQMRPGRGNSRQQPSTEQRSWQFPQDNHGKEPRRGEWLRNHQNLPPEQQDRELQNDPGFRMLPQQKQQQLRERWRSFNNLPPQQRMQVLHSMERWDQFSPQQKERARGLIGRFQSMSPDRQQILSRTARNLRGMSPQDRERALDSSMIRDTFSDSERDTLHQMLEMGIVPRAQGQPRP
jgi:hypothetical protein